MKDLAVPGTPDSPLFEHPNSVDPDALWFAQIIRRDGLFTVPDLPSRANLCKAI